MKLIVLLLLSSMVLAGCPGDILVKVPGHLYPIEGALVAQAPLPVYKVTISGVGNSGTMSATLQGGEVCNGRWARLRPDDPSANGLSAAWDRLYGAGFFAANVLGNSGADRAVLAGDKGTTLTVEFYGLDPVRMSEVRGVAMDNHGNVFKLTF
jgi:hypothetical protein